MEISDFAEAILFSENINEKMLSPEIFTDNRPSRSPLLHVPEPARPQGLRLGDWHARKKAEFPTGAALLDPKNRGLALHFFANHELLALELMALMLLRFPNAEPAFRAGVARTMVEEQGHFRLYLGQMKARGVEFGEIPLNNFFWNLLANVETPAHFAAGMSLTFEQANLDFALQYANLFEQAGDHAAAAVMQQVFADEIRHVGHGVKWLNVWGLRGCLGDSGTATQWERYVKHLPKGLSPARAKGPVFCSYARKQAGLDEEFINNLLLFAQSKGRPPRLWIFAPTVEMDWAMAAEASRNINVTKHNLPAVIGHLVEDLSVAVGLLASPDDIVVVGREPTLEFRQSLLEAGIRLPEYKTVGDLSGTEFAQRKLGALRPWGWSEQVIEQTTCFVSQCVVPHEVPSANLLRLTHALANKANVADWLDRAWSHMNRVSSQGLVSTLDFLSGGSALRTLVHGVKIANLSQLQEHLQKYPYVRHWLLKAPFSSSGRERKEFVLQEKETTAQVFRWSRQLFEKGHVLQLEPKLERIDDFSVQLSISDEGAVSSKGLTRFLTSPRGKYLGTFLGRRGFGLSPEVLRFLAEPFANTNLGVATFWDATSKWAICLGEVAASEGYVGPLGVDMMLYRLPGVLGSHQPGDLPDEISGGLLGHARNIFWRPLVELNPRYTMGRVALKLQTRISPSSYALWLQLTARDIGCSFSEFAYKVNKNFPKVFEKNGAPVLREGHLFTNDPAHAAQFVSCLFCATDKEKIKTQLRDLVTSKDLFDAGLC